MRTVRHAEHAIHTATVVVDMIEQHLFLTSCFRILLHLCFDDDGIIRTYILTNSTTNALVLVEFIVRKDELSTKTLEHFVFFAVFGVTLCNFRRPELAHRGFHSREQALHTSYKSREIILIFHCYIYLEVRLESQAETNEYCHQHEKYH